jgi:hypothetical protein
MSGYLHRLAARSLQTAPTVHSAARLPYAPLGMDDAPAPDPASFVTGEAAAAVPAPPRLVDTRAAGLRPPPPLPPVARAEGPRGTPQPVRRESRRSPPPDREAVEDADAARGPGRIFLPLVPPSHAPPPAPRDPVATGSTGAAPADPAEAPAVLHPPREDRAARQAAAPVEPARAPVLPRAVVERVAAAAREAEAGGRTVVEVHIGRIEVAAPPPPPAPRRAPAAPARRPMSLSEYLERRQGRDR